MLENVLNSRGHNFLSTLQPISFDFRHYVLKSIEYINVIIPSKLNESKIRSSFGGTYRGGLVPLKYRIFLCFTLTTVILTYFWD